jgi:hypothetical protein
MSILLRSVLLQYILIIYYYDEAICFHEDRNFCFYVR